MARKAMILKQQAGNKFSTRRYNRCKICGRPHAYLRDYGQEGKLVIFHSRARARIRILA